MLEGIKEIASKHPTHRSKLMKCCVDIQGLASVLSPYFEVVNIVVQVSPEYAGVAWGALRLIFIVSLVLMMEQERLYSQI